MAAGGREIAYVAGQDESDSEAKPTKPGDEQVLYYFRIAAEDPEILKPAIAARTSYSAPLKALNELTSACPTLIPQPTHPL